ncbi:TIGR00730 family Rossman fold protein [Haloplanus sp. GCM10025708]|uniref:LOG family protein n=1 Tax=Haloferacaceae TaxID=1644056 RepID=UPI003610FD42
MDRVCVYCGSNPGRDPAYVESATAFGEALVARDVGLVYGGGHVGMMGAIADAVLDAGGEAVGVIPEALADQEEAHTGLTELHVVGSMHERKQRMVDLADGFAALPGGLGTIEEIFEVLTWAQLGFHGNPCGFLNVAGYYDDLTAFLDHATDESFVRPDHRDIVHVEADSEALLDAFEVYEPPTVEKVIEGDET